MNMVPRDPLPLHNGDRLKQAEFHRRYREYPDGKQFELVGGTVFMASPVSRFHFLDEEELGFLLGLYRRRTRGVEVLPNTTTILGEDSEPQPDLSLRILQEWGGQSKETKDNFIHGPPEFLGEISYSTRSLDMNAKRADYKRSGVLEYLVVCIEEKELHWFHFPSDKMIQPNRQGILRSVVFPGLWLDGPAFLARDSARLMKVLEKGLKSREHAAFVKRLEAARRKSK